MCPVEEEFVNQPFECRITWNECGFGVKSFGEKCYSLKDLNRVELLQDRIGGYLKRFVRLPLDRQCLIKTTRRVFSVTQLRPTTVLKITHA